MIRPCALWMTSVDDRADVALGADEAPDLGVGRVGEQQVDALVAEPGEAGQVGDPAVERRLVHLEVAGVQDGLPADADRDGERVRDGVGDGEELQPPRADADPLALRDRAQVGIEAVLLELRRRPARG